MLWVGCGRGLAFKSGHVIRRGVTAWTLRGFHRWRGARKRLKAVPMPSVSISPFVAPQSLAEAQALDAADPLAEALAHFSLPEGVIYLDGHSLGPATHSALARVQAGATQDWRTHLIRSWNDAGWIDLPARIGGRLARLIGVEADEVLVCDSVSVNLFKLAAAALAVTPRRRLLVEAEEFPTDQYIAEGLTALTGAPLERIAAGAAETALREGGVLIKSVVNYRTGAVADLDTLEAAAQVGGARIIWDLSHAAGVLDLRLGARGVSLATGCGYKYLNGGPGAPAFVYVRRDLGEQLRTSIQGWFGHQDAFAFHSDYAPVSGVGRFAAGTPPILSCLALEGALEAFDGVSLTAVEAKARALGQLWLERAVRLGLTAASPRDPLQRGGHVTILHPDGYAIIQALIAQGIIGDFRAPDAMRFGFSPLFLRYADVWRAFDAFAEVLESGSFRDPRFTARAKVT